MKIHEYQTRRIFQSYAIPVPPGALAETPLEAKEVAQRLGTPVVIKAQVLVGGRGKAGGIKFTSTPEEAEKIAKDLLGSELKGVPVRRVLIQKRLEIAKEYYLGFTIDRFLKKVIMIGSPVGGVEIEEIAKERPEKVYKEEVHPFLGLQDYQARRLAYTLCEDKELLPEMTSIALRLYRVFIEADCSLAEINPLVVTSERQLYALDTKINLDDNALYRHPELAKLRDVEVEDPLEVRAQEKGLSYVKLEGEIGCIVNGAGLAMATMDLIQQEGGEPANFLDIGGGARAERIAEALRIVVADKKVKVILFNIFGGITRCDEVALGIKEALSKLEIKAPIVARLVGTNEKEGRALLTQTKVLVANTMDEAAKVAVNLSKGIGSNGP